MLRVSRALSFPAVVALVAATFVTAPTASAVVSTQTITTTLTGSGTWHIPEAATNIRVEVAASGGDAALGHQGGRGGVGHYLLADSTAGHALGYASGNAAGGSARSDNLKAYPGGVGSAIAVDGTLLAVTGGGGGAALVDHQTDGSVDNLTVEGGDGGVAIVVGVEAGEDGHTFTSNDASPGEGGQIDRGGRASTTAWYASSDAYAGGDGDDTTTVTSSTITLAAGGIGPLWGGGGGSGFTGGAGGVCDTAVAIGDYWVYYGPGGGGSGYLANDPRIAWDTEQSAGLNSGNGYVSVTYEVPSNLSVSSTAVSATFGDSIIATPLAVTGGTAPYAYAIAAGNLPPGLTLDPATGAIWGTPTSMGDVTLTISVTDSTAGTAYTETGTVDVTVAPNPSIAVAGPTQAGTTATVTGRGFTPGTYTVMLAGSAQPLGTVTAAADGSFSASVPVPLDTTPVTVGIDARSGSTILASTSLTVTPPPPEVRPSPVAVTFGEPVAIAPLAVSLGTAPYRYAITAGKLPPGLTLDPATGEIRGTPTSMGDVTLTIAVTDSTAGTPFTVAADVDITVAPNPAISAPASAQQGAQITVTGQGFTPGAYVLELHSDPVVLGTVTADASGAFSATVTVPATIEASAHTIVVSGGASTVVATHGIAITAAIDQLSGTGASSGLLVAACGGIAMIGIGFLARRFSRR